MNDQFCYHKGLFKDIAEYTFVVMASGWGNLVILDVPGRRNVKFCYKQAILCQVRFDRIEKYF